eukprot:GSChrysophyteH1.ASY1.ANO1.1829.1 assembled CDS
MGGIITAELPPFPTVGVKLSVFLKFINDNGGRDAFLKEPLTTTDVCNKFLKPITSEKEQSYCEYLQEQKSPDVGEASVFISHAWKYTFVEVVDALEDHFYNEPDIFIWFDLFSNNQHKAISFPFEWWRDTFLNAIGKLGRVVMVLSPWNNPIPFTRAWCLWEIYCAVKTGSKFEVAITPDQYTAFVEGITNKTGAFYQMLADINVEKSEAWSATDKERIFDAVKSSVGFAELNAMVIGKMREWVITAINESIKSLAISLKTLGAEHPEVTTSYSWLGNVYNSKGDKDKAIEYYEKSLAIKLKTLGAKHPKVATSYNNIGSVYNAKGDYAKAIEYHEKDLAISLKTLGAEHPEVATSYNNLGTVYNAKGDYAKAIEYHEKSLAIRLKTLGAEHPLVATSYICLGSVCYNKKDYKKALEYFEKSLAIRLKTLGVEHPNTKNSQQWIEIAKAEI